MIDKFTPEEVKHKLLEEKLKILRIWLSFSTFFSIVFSFKNWTNKEDPLPIWMQVVHNVLNLYCFICIIYSKYDNISAISYGMIAI